MNSWQNLLAESNNRGRGLEEAQDILEFNNQVDKIEAWIRDKVQWKFESYFINVVHSFYLNQTGQDRTINI